MLKTPMVLIMNDEDRIRVIGDTLQWARYQIVKKHPFMEDNLDKYGKPRSKKPTRIELMKDPVSGKALLMSKNATERLIQIGTQACMDKMSAAGWREAFKHFCAGTLYRFNIGEKDPHVKKPRKERIELDAQWHQLMKDTIFLNEWAASLATANGTALKAWRYKMFSFYLNFEKASLTSANKVIDKLLVENGHMKNKCTQLLNNALDSTSAERDLQNHIKKLTAQIVATGAQPDPMEHGLNFGALPGVVVLEEHSHLSRHMVQDLPYTPSHAELVAMGEDGPFISQVHQDEESSRPSLTVSAAEDTADWRKAQKGELSMLWDELTDLITDPVPELPMNGSHTSEQDLVGPNVRHDENGVRIKGLEDPDKDMEEEEESSCDEEQDSDGEDEGTDIRSEADQAQVSSDTSCIQLPATPTAKPAHSSAGDEDTANESRKIHHSI